MRLFRSGWSRCVLALTASIFALTIFSAQAEAQIAHDADELSIGPRMVLIIDDMGTNLAAGKAALALPGPINYAILPGTPHANTLLKLAQQQGDDTIAHVPMANTHHYPLGPGGLTPDMSKAQLRQVLLDDIHSLPGIIGINNHMGSLLTQDAQRMQWVMETLKPLNMLFVDSRTSAKTQALKAAQASGIAALERNVFLDDDQTEAAIKAQFVRAVKLAFKEGRVVVIGHPHPNTLKVLNEMLPQLDQVGISRVSLQAELMIDGQRQQLSTTGTDSKRAEISVR